MKTPVAIRISRLLSIALLVFARIGSSQESVTFTAYNVHNYETQEAPKRPIKPNSSIEALVHSLAQIKPDILGICEMGSQAALKDLQSRLHDAGIPLDHSEWINGPDPDRHLALLSKFPLIAKVDLSQRELLISKQTLAVRRGFLDVTVQITPSYRLRLIGAHLKSKLPVPEDESVVRRHEAANLREHIDQVLEQSPETNLLVYGDMNDTRESPPIRDIIRFRGKNALFDLPATDPLGDRWTHYWKTADTYARIDYLFANLALLPEIPEKRARILRDDQWLLASDHRPVSVTIIPVETAAKRSSKR